MTQSDHHHEPPPPSSTTDATPITLVDPRKKDRRRLLRHHHPSVVFRSVRKAFRAFPILTPTTPKLCGRLHIRRRSTSADHIAGAIRLTGTLFGHRKSRITVAIQENPRSVPVLLLDLPIPTAKFMTDMGSSGLIRVALECEKKPDKKTRLLEEATWTAFVNGKNVGTATRREAAAEDLKMMQMLGAVSMGAGVLPEGMTDSVDGEMTYMRAHFDRVVGSKDSETFYMLNPDGNTGPELSIFFVRI